MDTKTKNNDRDVKQPGADSALSASASSAFLVVSEWVKTCASSREFLAEYDRLRGTNLSMRGIPIDVLIDVKTRLIETEVEGFVEFCIDMLSRVNPQNAEVRHGGPDDTK